ncbi:MAG: DUF4292 domain-containing protein [Bacteroidetes bacterium]|nr:DUF4292 domain-containing protein [Bacteroidota bacterium]
MYKSIYFLTFLIITITSCRTVKKTTIKKTPKIVADTTKPMLAQIKNVINNSFEYDYLSFKSNCDYKDENTDQSFTMNFRMKKDSIIWISITAVGFEVARVKFDKDSVKILNRIGKKYYIYDYNYVKKMLGTSLNITQIQNLLTANIIFKPENYSTINIENRYRANEGYVENIIEIDKKYKISEQILQHLVEKTQATVVYTNYKKTEDQFFPGETEINVTTPAKNLKIVLRSSNLNYSDIESFPFEISSKYEKGN